ncbi:hypothetical protein PROFUN_11190 [Planoprotostelium fungivorum]|uniref:Uncharacterized protein n=1 Tax=Planoprotostelium fungivorum TaxID=1890364 RepID=A0A2P6NAV1_9EUKA|nr:hypothetical protein PROFUN_11190 [Planoprotostelium fungivorum]
MHQSSIPVLIETQGENPFILMDLVVDKLKLLDYERGFCRQKTTPALQKPLSHTYFALPHSNPNEQFFYFTSIVSFLMQAAGNNFQPPGQFSDPNATCATIVEELKKMGFVTDFAPTKLKEGYGETVCSVLNNLCDHALEKKGFRFSQPIHLAAPQGDDRTAEDEDDDEEEIIVADEAIVDDEDSEEVLGIAEDKDESNAMLESKVDPAEWLLEVEKVAPMLQLAKQSDKDWRVHLEKMQLHHKNIVNNLPDTKSQLDRMIAEISTTLDKIETREKHINNSFDHLIEEYKIAMEASNEITAKYSEDNEQVVILTNELQGLVDELQTVKDKMEAHNNSLADTTPLLKLKGSVQKLKDEISQFEVRIGVLEGTLLQAKLRAKKTAASINANSALAGAQVNGSFASERPLEVRKKMGANLSKDLEKAREKGIKELDLHDKGLERIPANIGDIKTLTKLNLSNNGLTTLPITIGGCNNIQHLNVFNNRLKELPTEITAITALQYFNASVNKLNALPRGFGAFNKMLVLDLSYNDLTELTPQIGLLTTLKELHLSFNQLTAIPPEIGQCVELERMQIGNNVLTDLPYELGKLVMLKLLDVNTNKIAILPPDVALLESIEKIDLSNNPLIPEIDAAARKGPKKLIEYLKSDDYDEVYFNARKKLDSGEEIDQVGKKKKKK